MTITTTNRIHRRHELGLSILCILLFAETISLVNAVSFWNSFHADDHLHTTVKFNSPAFSEAARRAEECNESKTCTSMPATQQQQSTNHFFSRLQSRLSKRHITKGTQTTTTDSCKDCSHCLNVACNDIRGGYTTTTSETIANTLKTTTTPYDIPLNAWKVIFQAFLTLLNVACWWLPLKSGHISQNKLALSLANSFSGGVFLSLAFGHLIPECVHGFRGMNEATPYMLVLSGYLLIFFVEKVAFDAHGMLNQEQEKGEKSTTQKNGESNNIASGKSALILMGALAVHSILEMTALGLADTFGDSALLTLSIALHQPAESIALLVAFIKSGVPEADIIRFLSIFSAMGPIGVALGMAVNEFAAPIVDAIMLAVVAGTFVYVGATEVIPEEFEEPDHKWNKFAALMAGLISVFMVTQYTTGLEAGTS